MLSTTLITIALFLLLNINETVKIQDGEIISANSPIEYHAPEEAEVIQILVEPGQAVSEGDTLIVLNNDQIKFNYKKTQESYWLSLANLDLLKKKLENLQNKVKTIEESRSAITSNYNNDRLAAGSGVTSLEKQVAGAQEMIDVSSKQLNKEHQLLLEGVISQADYDQKYQEYLLELNKLSNLEKQLNQLKYERSGLTHQYRRDVKNQKMSTLQTEYEIIDLKKAIFEEEVKVSEFANKMVAEGNTLKKMTVISEINGYVTNIYNEKQDLNFVTKSTPLITVSPEREENFFARTIISQEMLNDVQVGQKVHLKVNAYNYYRYGVLVGEVTNISKAIDQEGFVVITTISENPELKLKSGFRVKGDIILERVKLFKFVLRRVFTSI